MVQIYGLKQTRYYYGPIRPKIGVFRRSLLNIPHTEFSRNLIFNHWYWIKTDVQQKQTNRLERFVHVPPMWNFMKICLFASKPEIHTEIVYWIQTHCFILSTMFALNMFRSSGYLQSRVRDASRNTCRFHVNLRNSQTFSYNYKVITPRKRCYT